MPTKLKDLAKVDRPREKLLKQGPQKLKNYELLSIILGSGIKGKNVLTLAKAINAKVTKIQKNNITLADISSIKGVGTVKSLQILATLELIKRWGNSNTEILSDKDIYNLCLDIVGSKKEHFLAFFLDTQDKFIERQIISIGTLNSSLIHPRELFEPAIRLHAASIIIVHNHPSGSLTASDSDVQVTKKLKSSGEILGIPIHYHLIITPTGYSRIDVGLN